MFARFLAPFGLLLAMLVALALPAAAEDAPRTELLMVEQAGCHYCIEWKATVGPIYPKTSEGTFAPLRLADLHKGPPEGVTYARKVNFTPTFILLENNSEIGRIEGYPGEDFFWGLLDMMLKAKTNYTETLEETATGEDTDATTN